MLLRSVTKHVKDQNWFAVILDLAIVVFGVFIGLQVSNWNENLVQKEATKVLIKRLYEDLGKEHEVISVELDYYADVKKYAIKALHGFNNEALVKDKQYVNDEQFVIAAYQASQTSGVWSYRSAYSELIRTGNINFIENESLKNLILGYYSEDLKSQNSLLTEVYVEYIRSVMPYEIQDRIRNECGDIVVPVAKNYGYRLPETCDLQLPPTRRPDMLKKLVVLFMLATTTSCSSTHEQVELLSSADLANFDNPAPDARLHYGDNPLQFGDLRVPPGPGLHPVAVFIHGGCWLSQYGIEHSSKLTAALARNGIATWSLEYRRVGDEGGGWPGTFLDIGRGTDYLRSIAKEYDLDLDRVITMGHSAGGHLALWAAARSRLPAEAPVSVKKPLAVRGVLALAPAPDLAVLHEQKVCGHVIDGLMGGSPDQVPDRYRWGDPMQLAPEGVPQVLIIGKHDSSWAPSGRRYFDVAKKRGDNVRLIEATESGHFEMIDPDSTTWRLVLDAARGLF